MVVLLPLTPLSEGNERDFWRGLIDRVPEMFKQRLVQKIQISPSLQICEHNYRIILLTDVNC